MGSGTARHRLALTWPWAAILLITSGFQFGRGAPIDGIVFAGVSIALLLDAAVGPGLRRRQSVSNVRRPARLRLRLPTDPFPRRLTVVVGAAAAAIVGFAPSFAPITGALVVLCGVLAMSIAWPHDRAMHPLDAASGRSAGIWAVLVIALCAWEVVNFFLGLGSAHADWEHPALSDLLAPLLAQPPLRAVGFAIWLLSGAALLRRGLGPGARRHSLRQRERSRRRRLAHHQRAAR